MTSIRWPNRVARAEPRPRTSQVRSTFRTCVGWRGVAKGIGDAAAWMIAMTIGVLERFDFRTSQIAVHHLALFIVGAVVVQAVVGTVFGLYVGRWRTGGLEEAGAVTADALVVTALLFAADQLFRSHPVPASSVVSGGFTALVLMGGARYAARIEIDQHRRPSLTNAIRLVVFGAGEGATQAVDAMLCNARSPYVPVALLDDAPQMRTHRIRGVRVEGGRHDLAGVAQRHGADAVLIAIPSADKATIAELTQLAHAAGLRVKVLPPVGELFGAAVDLGDIRDVRAEDLLGRGPIDTNVAVVAGYLNGKRVVVTGAGGSIGSELCQQIMRFEPSELIMIDRDESALHGVQLMLEGRGLLDSPNLVLLNIHDRESVRDLFQERRPQVVFHAAALKHLPLLERYPWEAVQTNIFGSLHILDAAREVGVERFVNISTDKAADPVSMLGATKRIAERMTAHVGCGADGDFVSVRFGNVLGSRGSVLTAFRAQADAGGPITVTDPDVTRYFMTVTEAVGLVIHAGAIGRSGEVLVLDMGQPVRIADVARRFADRAPGRVEVVFTGLRPGEKLHEVLLGDGEVDDRPFHPLISHVAAPPLDPAATEAFGYRLPPAECRAAALAMCTRERSTVAADRLMPHAVISAHQSPTLVGGEER